MIVNVGSGMNAAIPCASSWDNIKRTYAVTTIADADRV